MIEFDVDMGYLLEEGELDCVVLNDENGEHEPMTFMLGGGECENVGQAAVFKCSECGWYSPVFTFGDGMPQFCPSCGAKVRKAVKR